MSGGSADISRDLSGLSKKQNRLKQKSAVNFTALCLHIKPITQLLSFSSIDRARL